MLTSFRCMQLYRARNCSTMGFILRFSMFAVFVVSVSARAQVGYRSYRDTQHIGSNYLGKPVVLTIVYDRCLNGIPWEYRFTYERNINYRDGFNATILEKQKWGFRVRIQRIDSAAMNWHQSAVALNYYLIWISTDFDDNPCQNGGNCSNHLSGHKCHCTPEYHGELCERRLIYCYPDPCNGGECRELENDYECVCPPEITGRNCTKGYVDEEAKILFENPETTSRISTILYPTCKGLPPFKIEVSPNDGGSPSIGTKILEIFSWGFKAKFWRENNLETLSAPGTFLVRWRALFDTLNYSSNPCENGGSCRNVVNGTTCDCPVRTTGKFCETRLTHCFSSPCLNGGSCIPTSSSYNCNCTQQFAGDRCDTEPSVSSVVTLPRFSGGGPPYGSKVAVTYDDCHTGIATKVKVTVTTLNSTSHEFSHTILDIHSWGFQVLVRRNDNPDVGWEENKVTLEYEAIFETRNSLENPCVHSLTCSNDEAEGRRCNCDADYGGEFCERELTPCDPNPCVTGNCTESEVGYVCACPQDKAGKNCEISTKISTHRSLGNQPNAQPYIKTVDIIYYKCQVGLAQRVDFNIVGDRRHRFNSTLEGIYPWGFRLSVIRTDRPKSGWFYGSGTIYWTAFFDVMKPFKRHCLNGGYCVNGDEGRICRCTQEYGGVFCEKRLKCYPNPCNGGRCEEDEDGFECSCLQGWSGKTCDIKGAWESGVYHVGSHNGAVTRPGKVVTILFDQCYTLTATDVTATAKGGRWYYERFRVFIQEVHRWGFKALVKKDHSYLTSWDQTGVNMKWKAEFASHDYLINPCANGANCTNLQSGQTCQCTEDYNGEFCESRAVYCKTPNLCNGGVCTDLGSDYQCKCPRGRGGKNCEKGLKVAYVDIPFTDTTTTTITKTLLFSSCLKEIPEQVDVKLYANISSTVGVKVLDIFIWGITVKMWRENEGDYPRYEPTALEYRLIFNSTDVSAANPCYPGGTCRNVVNGTTCDCYSFRSGRFCETKLDYCWSSPCLNGGRCHVGHSRYYCFCDEPFTGDRCEIEPSISGTASVPRYHADGPPYGQTVAVRYSRCYTGTATSVRATITRSRYYADRFNYTILGIYPWGFRALVQRTDRPGDGWDQTEVKLRWTSVFGSRSFTTFPCQHSINCYNSEEHGRKCNCQRGFVGEFCETALRFCYPNPCNGGTCFEFGNDYNCTCPELRAGKNCEISLKLSGLRTVRPLRLVPPYYKTVSVAYAECQSSLAFNITASASGSADNPETFDTKVMGVFPWGFRVRVWRTDRPETRWKQRRVNLHWIAHFDDSKTLGDCENSGICVNNLNGRQCSCGYGYTGDYCESYGF